MFHVEHRGYVAHMRGYINIVGMMAMEILEKTP
jgi:hypothetical protein